MDKPEENKEIILAYALGALDEAEARDCAAQVESDAELAAELEAWHEVASHLIFVVDKLEPSAGCREKLLNSIRDTTQSTENRKAENLNSQSTRPQTFASAENSIINSKANSNVLPFPVREKRGFFNYLPAAGAIAASIIAVLLGISLDNAVRRNQIQNDQLASLNQRLEQTEQKLNLTAAELERERQEREMLASPSTIVAALDGTKETPAAKARLVFDRRTGRALLFVENLPNAPQGKSYQIWWITDPKKPAPGGVFETDNNGKGVLHDQIPAAFTKASIFAVTLEPAGGSAAPTGAAVLKTPI